MDNLYFIEIEGLKIRGKWFLETDRDDTRADVLETIRQYDPRVLKVLEVNESEGTCLDVTEEILSSARMNLLEAAE